MAATKPFPSLQEFLFNTPLYAAYELSDGAVAGLFNESFRVDGHCPYCRSSATFIRALETNLTVRRNNQIDVLTAIAAGWDPPKHYFLHIGISCARKPTEHTISFVLLKSSKIIQKVGQFPSLADIANDESKAYRPVLSEQDSQELHKAIGLAAHGVGIGSYVYLRRIFERLIDSRFNDFKDEEGWSEQGDTSSKEKSVFAVELWLLRPCRNEMLVIVLVSQLGSESKQRVPLADQFKLACEVVTSLAIPSFELALSCSQVDRMNGTNAALP